METCNPQKKRRLIKPNNLASSSWQTQSLEASDDIITEILHRLPWKSLARFECVSKHWLNLITSPEFIRPLLPKKEDPDVMVGMFYQYCFKRKLHVKFAAVNKRVKALSCLDYRFSFLPCRTICIIGCQHGLILCSTSRKSRYYYVCNPITKQYVRLPRLEVESLIFLIIGLYVEKESGHFQVVVIPFLSKIQSNPVQVFSSRTGSWKKIAFSGQVVVPRDFVYSYGCQGVQGYRSIYWLHPNCNLVVYDIDKETISVNRAPYNENGSLGEINGVIRYTFTDDLSKTAIWELRKDWWECVRHVDTSAIIRTLIPKITSWNSMHKLSLTPIGFHSSDPDVVFFKLGPKIFSYKFKTEEAELLMDNDVECVTHGAFFYHLPKVPFPFPERKRRKRKEKKRKRKEKVMLPKQ